jgi:hypothetical protein
MMAAWAALILGNLNDARAHFSASLRIFRHTGDDWNGGICLAGLCHVMLAGGYAPQAASLLGAAIALFQRSPRQPTSDERNWLEPLVQSVMAQLDEAEYRRAWQAGHDGYEEKLDEAVSVTGQRM